MDEYSDNFYVIAETNMAILVTVDPIGGPGLIDEDRWWLPRSQIQTEEIGLHDVTGDRCIKVTMPQWLAEEKELV